MTNVLGNLQRSGVAVKVAVLLAVALWFGLTLRAEPYFAVREGYKCSKCHVNKTGGGKRTDYGTVYMQTRMAATRGAGAWMKQPEEVEVQTQALLPGMAPEEPEPAAPQGARSNFAHGHLNESFSVGADLRVAYGQTQQLEPGGSTEEWFGRESRCSSCHEGTDGGGKRAEFYAQAELVPERVSIYLGQNLIPTVSPREMFALIEELPADAYVKAGTFRLPAGLNNGWDDPFIHGTNPNQTYFGERSEGVEVGVEPGPFSLSVSVTEGGGPVVAAEGSSDLKRTTVNGYAVGDAGMLGMLYMLNPLAHDQQRTVNGIYGGISVGRITWLLQYDTIEFEEQGQTTDGVAGMTEVDFLLTRGHNIKYVYEFIDPDTDTDHDIRDRNSLLYEPFYTPNLQLRLGARRSEGPRGDLEANTEKYFLELHLAY